MVGETDMRYVYKRRRRWACGNNFAVECGKSGKDILACIYGCATESIRYRRTHTHTHNNQSDRCRRLTLLTKTTMKADRLSPLLLTANCSPPPFHPVNTILINTMGIARFRMVIDRTELFWKANYYVTHSSLRYTDNMRTEQWGLLGGKYPWSEQEFRTLCGHPEAINSSVCTSDCYPCCCRVRITCKMCIYFSSSLCSGRAVRTVSGEFPHQRATVQLQAQHYWCERVFSSLFLSNCRVCWFIENVFDLIVHRSFLVLSHSLLHTQTAMP